MSDDTEEKRITMKEFIDKHQLEMNALPTHENPHMDDKDWPASHFSIEIKQVGKGNRQVIRTYFSQGMAHKGKPKFDAVLDCLASDASCVENARDFEDFCSELGYDSDSRRAYKTWELCSKQAEELKNFLGNDAYQELLYGVEKL